MAFDGSSNQTLKELQVCAPRIGELAQEIAAPQTILMMERYDTVVIGGGQAGLAMSYYLSQLRQEHIVLERARVAERWRTQRWDSLMFQFPNWGIELPGCVYAGDDPDGFSHKDEVLRFIEGYCKLVQAPVRTGVNVLALRSSALAGRYELCTTHGIVEARSVVIATGPYQRPLIPKLALAFPPDLIKLHSSEYRNPAALPPGAVLIVGSGASGCQIAEELLEAGRRVLLSVGRHRRLPRRYRGQDSLWWRRELGEWDKTADQTPEALRPDFPLVTGVHGGHDVDLRRFAADGMTLLGRVVEVRDGKIILAPDLEDNLRHGDDTFEDFTREVDRYVSLTGMDVPVPLAQPEPTSVVETIGEIDFGASGIRSVIWATGYGLDFSWVELPIFDGYGKPIHYRGVTAAPGIYFLGLRWLHKPKSSSLWGVGEDAEYLAQRI